MSNDTDDIDFSDVREESTSGGGNRIDADAAQEERLIEELVAAMNNVENGNTPKTLSFWGPEEAAITDVVMADDEERAAMVDEFSDELGVDVDGEEIDRSRLLKLALRFAFAQANPSLMEDVREARRKRAVEKADEGF